MRLIIPRKGKFDPASAFVIHRNVAWMKSAGIIMGNCLRYLETMMEYGDFYQTVGPIRDKHAEHFSAGGDRILEALAMNVARKAYAI